MEAMPTLLAAAATAADGGLKVQASDLQPRCPVPATLADLTPAFFTAALRAAGVLPAGPASGPVVVAEARVAPTAVAGLLSTTGRAALRYEGGDGLAHGLPASVIVKLQAEDEACRAIALGADNYEMERRIYERLAEEMEVGTARCLHISADPSSGNVVFVMEDLCLQPGLYSIDQWRPGGCTPAEAAGVARALGKLHAQYWSWSGELPSWLPHTNSIEARNVVGLVADCAEAYRASPYYEALGARERGAVEAVLSRAPEVNAALASGPKTLLHHDGRADNFFWGKEGAPGGVVILDWQMVGQGVGPIDLAWFSSTSFLEPGTATRLEENRRLVDVYWHALTEGPGGVDPERYTAEAAWRDYLIGLAWSFLVVVQVVKFGEPNAVLHAFSARAAHAMVETGAHEAPCERLVQ